MKNAPRLQTQKPRNLAGRDEDFPEEENPPYLSGRDNRRSYYKSEEYVLAFN